MARKEDKHRPYRIDYFYIDQMSIDMALVRSVIIRDVTAKGAIANLVPYDNLVIIRAYRYYKNLVHKKDVYRAVEDLFPANKAIKIMERVEAYRAAPPPAPTPTPVASASLTPAVAVPEPTPIVVPTPHATRLSDSSLYDEVCVNCGATDTSGKLDQSCPAQAQPTLKHLLSEVKFYPDGSPEQKEAIIKYLTALDAEPTEVITENLKALDAEPIEVITECLKALDATTGPDSPATKAVVADLQGMLARDAHEKTMDTFVPDSVPEGRRFPDPTNTPITTPVPVAAEQPKSGWAELATPETSTLIAQAATENAKADQPTVVGRAPTSWTYGLNAECLGNPPKPSVAEPLIEPDQAVGCSARPAYLNPPPAPKNVGEPFGGSKLPLWANVLIFGGVLLTVLGVIHFLLHH